MADPYAARVKIVEKLIPLMTASEVRASREEARQDHEAIGVFVLEHRAEILKALMRPPAMAGPAEIETLEKIIFHHFYPGPLSGSTTRLATALIAAYPALQGHEG